MRFGKDRDTRDHGRAGDEAHAQSTVEDLSQVLADVRTLAEQEGEQEITEAIDELQQALREEEPVAGLVAEKASSLRKLAAGVGNAALSSAVTSAVETATGLIIGGYFG